MIEFTSVQKQFGRFQALKNINLRLDGGSVTALIGPNACGKTTLLKTLLGMVVPNSGDIRFDGKSILGSWDYRKDIGYMPQIGKYPENMTVEQVITMIEGLRQGSAVRTDKELYRRFGLAEILQKRMRNLSGGTRQKVSAYLAFLFDPQVLILDEPTAGLDPISSLILKEKIVREKEEGKLIVITSHVLSELDDIVDQIVYMEEGRIIFHKPIERLKSETQKTKLTEAIAFIMNKEKTYNLEQSY